MKKCLIALSAFTIIALSANAQTQRNTDEATTTHQYKKGGKKHHHGNAMIMKELNLSDAQKQQAKTLREDYKIQFKQLDENKSSMSLQDYQAKKGQIRKDQRSKFESILTADQKIKMEDLKKNRMVKSQDMNKKRLDRMKSTLNLTDDQVSKLQSQHESFKAQAKGIKENTSLTDEQKKENLIELRKRSQEDEKAILTAEQLQKKEEMKNKRMHDWKNKSSEKS